jgi:hypothetical protein
MRTRHRHSRPRAPPFHPDRARPAARLPRDARLAPVAAGARGSLPRGRFAAEQPCLGCHRPRCGLCHPDKRWHRGADRVAAECAWRRDWADELP